MSDDLSISPDKVRAGATRLTELHQTLASAAQDINRKHADLHESWTGSAATLMMTRWQKEFSALTPFIDQLTGMAEKLTTAADSLVRQDLGNSNSFSRLDLPEQS